RRRQDQRDPIALPHAKRGERDGRSVALLVQMAPGELASLEDQGRRIRPFGRVPAEMVEQRARRRIDRRRDVGVVMGEPGAWVHGGTLSGTDAVGSWGLRLSGSWGLRLSGPLEAKPVGSLGDFGVGSSITRLVRLS